MNNSLYDFPAEGFINGIVLLVSYITSILLKQFTIDIVLPSITLFLISSLPNYIILAFLKTDKKASIRKFSLIVLLILTLLSAVTYGFSITDNTTIKDIVEKNYAVLYIFCFIVVSIPFIDALITQFDVIEKTSIANSQIESNRAYYVMINGINNKYKENK